MYFFNPFNFLKGDNLIIYDFFFCKNENMFFAELFQRDLRDRNRTVFHRSRCEPKDACKGKYLPYCYILRALVAPDVKLFSEAYIHSLILSLSLGLIWFSFRVVEHEFPSAIIRPRFSN